MSRTEHTPGPYIVIKTARKVPHILCAGPDGGLIGQCNTRKTDEENEANARLFASSPDLLAVCKALVSWNDDANSNGERLDAIDDLARAAIAKAEGRGT